MQVPVMFAYLEYAKRIKGQVEARIEEKERHDRKLKGGVLGGAFTGKRRLEAANDLAKLNAMHTKVQKQVAAVREALARNSPLFFEDGRATDLE